MSGILYRCEICEKQFKRKFHLKTHERVHSKEKPYKCCICSRRFSHKCSMDRHQMLHSTSGGFFCSEPLCRKRFTSKDHLVTHVKAIHQNKKPYRCEICDQHFAYKHVYAKHVARFHTAGDAENRCENNCSASQTCASERRYSDIVPRTASNLKDIVNLINEERYNSFSLCFRTCGKVCTTSEEFGDYRCGDENKQNITSLAALFAIKDFKDKQEKCIPTVIKQEVLNSSSVNLHDQAEQVKFNIQGVKQEEKFQNGKK